MVGAASLIPNLPALIVAGGPAQGSHVLAAACRLLPGRRACASSAGWWVPAAGERLANPLFLGPHLSSARCPATRCSRMFRLRAESVRAAHPRRRHGASRPSNMASGLPVITHAPVRLRDRDGIRRAFRAPSATPKPLPIVSSQAFADRPYAIHVGRRSPAAQEYSWARIAKRLLCGAGGDRPHEGPSGFATASAPYPNAPLQPRSRISSGVLENPAHSHGNIPGASSLPAPNRRHGASGCDAPEQDPAARFALSDNSPPCSMACAPMWCSPGWADRATDMLLWQARRRHNLCGLNLPDSRWRDAPRQHLRGGASACCCAITAPRSWPARKSRAYPIELDSPQQPLFHVGCGDNAFSRLLSTWRPQPMASALTSCPTFSGRGRNIPRRILEWVLWPYALSAPGRRLGLP